MEWCELMFSLLQSNAFGLAAHWEKNWKHIFLADSLISEGFLNMASILLKRLCGDYWNCGLACCFSCLLRRAWKNKHACRNLNGRFKGHPGCKHMATQNSCIASASRPRQSETLIRAPSRAVPGILDWESHQGGCRCDTVLGMIQNAESHLESLDGLDWPHIQEKQLRQQCFFWLWIPNPTKQGVAVTLCLGWFKFIKRTNTVETIRDLVA